MKAAQIIAVAPAGTSSVRDSVRAAALSPISPLLPLVDREGAHVRAIWPVDHIKNFHSLAVSGNFPPHPADNLAVPEQIRLGYVAVDALRGGSVPDTAARGRLWLAVVGDQGFYLGLLAIGVFVFDDYTGALGRH